jgi:hypothetical protein
MGEYTDELLDYWNMYAVRLQTFAMTNYSTREIFGEQPATTVEGVEVSSVDRIRRQMEARKQPA